MFRKGEHPALRACPDLGLGHPPPPVHRDHLESWWQGTLPGPGPCACPPQPPSRCAGSSQVTPLEQRQAVHLCEPCPWASWSDWPLADPVALGRSRPHWVRSETACEGLTRTRGPGGSMGPTRRTSPSAAPGGLRVTSKGPAGTGESVPRGRRRAGDAPPPGSGTFVSG